MFCRLSWLQIVPWVSVEFTLFDDCCIRAHVYNRYACCCKLNYNTCKANGHKQQANKTIVTFTNTEICNETSEFACCGKINYQSIYRATIMIANYYVIEESIYTCKNSIPD